MKIFRWMLGGLPNTFQFKGSLQGSFAHPIEISLPGVQPRDGRIATGANTPGQPTALDQRPRGVLSRLGLGQTEPATAVCSTLQTDRL